MNYWNGYRWTDEAPHAPPPQPSTPTAIARHIVSRLSEATVIVGIVGALAFGSALFVGHPAGAGLTLAAKGGAGNGNGGNSGGGTGAGAAVSSIALDQAGSTLALGTPVTFTTSVTGLTGTEYALVYLKCTENGAVVYGQLDLPGTTFVLGGGSSPWWQVGGTATCVGYLEAYGSHGGYDTIRVLAQTAAFTAN
jgi:hypothetical protein